MHIDRAPHIRGSRFDGLISAVGAPRFARRRGNRLSSLKLFLEFLLTLKAFEQADAFVRHFRSPNRCYCLVDVRMITMRVIQRATFICQIDFLFAIDSGFV
jgi:hypothetical protein